MRQRQTVGAGSAGIVCAVILGAMEADAQVYSVNAVGYVNITFEPGYRLVCNTLINDDTVGNSIGQPPEGTSFIRLVGQDWVPNTFSNGAWNDPEMKRPLAEGMIVYSPAPWTDTTVGEVAQGWLRIELHPGLNLVGSKVPQQGLLSATLGFPRQPGTIVHTINPVTGAFVELARHTDFGWEPAEPVLGVGEAILVETPIPLLWERHFSVNDGSAPPEPPPLIKTHPASVEVKRGEPAILRVSTVDEASLYNFQWYRDGQQLPAANGAELVVPNVSEADAGNYYVRVSRAGDVQSSQVARLSVVEPEGPLLNHVSFNRASATLSLRWTSEPDRQYAVEFATNLGGWVTIVPFLPSQGATTSMNLPGFPDYPRAFFRVRQH